VRYTLVPVPSEYVLDVMRWVLFRVPDEGGESTGRDKARVIQLLEELDDFKRALVVLIAKSVLRGDSLTLRDAAEELGQPPQVVSDSLRAINRRALEARDIVTLRTETAVGVLGQRGKASVVTMRPDIARMVRAAARSASVSGD
jgi:hypothetical protein